MLFLNCDSKWSARTSVTLLPISVMIEKKVANERAVEYSPKCSTERQRAIMISAIKKKGFSMNDEALTIKEL